MKSLGLTREQVLWENSYQNLFLLMEGVNYSSVKSEEEWVEIETIDGMKRVRKVSPEKIM